MMGLKATFVFAACIVVFAESGKVRRDIMLCDGLARCLTEYNKLGDPTEGENLEKLKVPGALDTYCSSVEGIGACVQSEAPMCWFEDEVSDAEIAASIAEYVCASQNRPKFLEIAARPNTCLTTSVSPIERETENCANVFQTDVLMLVDSGRFTSTSDVCPLVHDMGKCIVSKLNTMCDPDVVEFFDGLLVDFINPLGEDEFGCSPSTTFMKRYIRGLIEELSFKRSAANLLSGKLFKRR